MKFDVISVAGLLVSFIGILVGQAVEGGHLGSLIQLTAFLIVIGGTLGAVMLQSSMRVFLTGMRMIRWVFQRPAFEPQLLIQDIVTWSNTARRGGLLALEPLIADQSDAFRRKAIQMLVDGAEPDTLRDSLDLDIRAYGEFHRAAAKVWDAAGGYSPTIGILGAVLGLIHVMENLADPSKLGAGIAVAFVATIYGVGGANLLFLPIGNKLKGIVAEQATLKEMLVDGLVAIANGENPRVIESRLQGYVV